MIRSERPEEGVAVITLARPEKKNALSVELRERGNALLGDLAEDETVRCLVVTGEGSVFCAGFDLPEFERAADDPVFGERLWASSDEWHRRWITFPVPVVAALNGPAIAGGFDVAVMADLRVAAEGVWFSHPEIRFGDVVFGPLEALVGGSVARDLCFTGRRMEASEARAVGLVNRLVPSGDVLAEALSVAREIVQAPRDVLVRTKAKVVRRVAGGATLEL